jgi:CHAT domain-containing protein/Tfp pilus assembly protein PilF
MRVVNFKIILILASWILVSQTPVRPQVPIANASSGASTATEASKASDVFQHARELYSNEGARTALPEFEKALELFRKEGDRKGEAITIGLIGNCYKRFGEFAKALDYLQRALSMKQEIGDRGEEGKTLSHLGLLYRDMSEYSRAIEYFRKAIAVGHELNDRILEASSRNNLGLVYDDRGEYRLSLEEYNRALELYRGTGSEGGISDTIGNIGGQHLLLGDYSEALRYYQEALAIDERLKLKIGISQDLENIGLCYIGLGRASEAIQTLDRAIRLATEAGLKKEAADSQKAKGSALVQLGKYNQAFDQFHQALQAYEQAGLKQESIEGLGDLGNLEIRLGDAGSAEKEFRRALELSRAINHPRGVIYSLIALGDLEWRRKRFTEAAALYKDALARATEANDRAATASAHLQLALAYRDLKRFEDAAVEIKPALEIARAIQARPLEAQALYVQGEVERFVGREDEALTRFTSGEALVAQIADPELGWRLAYARGQALEALNRNEEALSAYQSAVKIIEQVRSELREERFRAGYIEDKYQVYVTLVQLLLKLGKADEAFVTAERLRARSYLDLLSRGQPPVRDDSQRQKETGLRNRIRELQRKLEEEANRPSPQRRGEAFELFSKELADAERSYENFLDDLLRTDPNYAAVRALKVPNVDALKSQLPAGTALIEYVLAENSLEIFVLTGGELRARSIPVRASDMKSRVEFLRDVLLRKKTNEWQAPAKSLYQTLIAPIEEAGWLRGINRIYIVPHAILHYLPFAALVKNGVGGTRFLVDDYVLAYLPAAAALVYGGKAATSSSSVLAMAPSSTRLRYTQKESQDVSGFFPKQHMLLLGGRATESAFKRLANNYDVIHLATHGYFNKLNPLLSGVALEADGENDGRLEVHEILSLRLNAKLVTLSACDTALGSGYFAEVPAGDDLVGLTRAFLFAGSPTVLASLWEINDLSAVHFMHGFYRQLGQTDKANALAKAQRDTRLRGGIYRHPYYWGAFVLVGKMK